MAEYIDRAAVLEIVNQLDDQTALVVGRKVANLPAANVALVVHGRWAHDHYQNCTEQFEIVRCTICGHKAYAEALHIMHGNYCPNCGAKMDR